MEKPNLEAFQELHHNQQEYCRESGPLKSKARTFPKALLNGLELVAAALAAMTLAGSLLSFSVVSSPLSIQSHSADIRLNVRNLPEEGELSYILSMADAPGHILSEGDLHDGLQDLSFQGLYGETQYILKYYIDGELVDHYGFITGPDSSPHIKPSPSPSAAPSPTLRPSPSPKPTPSSTPSPSPSPTPSPSPSPSPTPPPYVPPDPDPVPTPAPSPEPSPVPGTPQASANSFVVDGIVAGYAFNEVHTFENIPSDKNTVEIIYESFDGELVESSPIDVFESVYDPAAHVLTVTFSSEYLPKGRAGTSLVTVTTETGLKLQSSQTLISPDLDSISTAIRMAEDGTILYTVSGSWTPPNFGSVDIVLGLVPDSDGVSDEPPLMQTLTTTLTNPDTNFSYTFTVSGVSTSFDMLTAYVWADAKWDADTQGESQSVNDWPEYSVIPPLPGGDTPDPEPVPPTDTPAPPSPTDTPAPTDAPPSPAPTDAPELSDPTGSSEDAADSTGFTGAPESASLRLARNPHPPRPARNPLHNKGRLLQ